MRRLLCLTALVCGLSAGAAHAAAIRIACYDDGNECEITQQLAASFMKLHPDIAITIDKTPYKAIVESLPVQLASGNGPDIARATNFGALAPYFLNLAPLLKDAAYWQKNFGPTLDWMRVKPGDTGIYGLPTQMTVTGLIVNKSLFDQASVPMPGPKASWDDWAAAVDKVAKATNTPYGMAFDRSGHRFAGPAISMGAKYFKPDGTPQVVDAGFKAMAAKFVAWSKNKTIDPDIWGAQATGYRDAFAEFANGKIVAYLSGSWQVHRLATQVGDGFDWKVVPNPCGPAACTGMPGGAAFVAFKATKSPAAVAAFLDYLASAPVYESWMAQTDNVPAHLGLQKAKIAYVGSAAAVAALQAFSAAATQLSPIAYKLQGYAYNQVLFGISVDRIAQVTTGQLTLAAAYERITSDVAAQLAAARK